MRYGVQLRQRTVGCGCGGLECALRHLGLDFMDLVGERL